MKNKYKFVLALLPMVLVLGACQENTTSSTTTTSEDPILTTTTTSRPAIIQDITIYYYRSIYESIAGQTYYTGHGRTHELITDVPEEPESNDPAFNTFVGWSTKPLVASSEDLWDFSVDTVPENLYPPVLTLYGIWDYVE